MKIGELSRRTGVSVRSLRYYEEQLLLAPTRTAGGHREYPESAVDRVILVQQLFAAGLHSPRIAELLPCMRAPEGGPNERATTRLADQLAAERERIDLTISDLVRSRALLDEIIAAARAEPDQDTIGARAARA